MMSGSNQMRTLPRALADHTRSVGGAPALPDSILGPVWRRARKKAGRPNGVLSAEEGYRLAELHARELRAEMRRVCSRFGAARLFSAVRFWTHVVIGGLGLNFGEEISPEAIPLATMALRRIAANAALLYVGDMLVLAEVKGKYMARAPEAFSRLDIVKRRWEENLRFLRKIDRTARLLALRKDDGTFREALRGFVAYSLW